MVVIGAGPKAAAIAAKVSALHKCGFIVPEVVVVERREPGANWGGKFGFTDGDHRLGTPPEKDVGFPYDDEYYDSRVSEEMLARYSWQSYLANTPGRYGEWIDRGRAHPFHRDWARYLAWVLRRAERNGPVQMLIGEAIGVSPVNSAGWQVRVRDTHGKVQKISADAVVITGPGGPKTMKVSVAGGGAPSDPVPGLYNGVDYWTRLGELQRLRMREDEEICVIGSGETAASVVVDLAKRFTVNPILVLNRHGTIFSRGEGFHENRTFTDPDHRSGTRWSDLEDGHRGEVIQRADRGVFSLDTIADVNRAENVVHVLANVTEISIEQHQLGGNTFMVKHQNAETGPAGLIEAAIVVDATGFTERWFLELFPKKLKEKFEDAPEVSFGSDLSVVGIQPGLHLPTIAGRSQGPGFPNLSCLGRLSNRILSKYVQPPTTLEGLGGQQTVQTERQLM